MTTERLRSLECVPITVRDRPRYVGDHVIRRYRPLGLAALLRDLGADPTTPDITIVGGIGRLVLRADGSEVWEPTLRGTPAPPPVPRPADPALAAVRRSTCAACPSWAARCTAAGCGCAGEGRPDVWSSRCPLAKWPAARTADCT
jgi:hypothetical protein